MAFNRKKQQDYYDEFKERVDKLKNNNDTIPNDDQLAERFKQVFNTESTIKQEKPIYEIPNDMDDKEIENLLLQAGLSDSDSDDYLNDILQDNSNKNNQQCNVSTTHDKTIKEWENRFLSLDNNTTSMELNDQEYNLLQQLKDQVAVEKKYESYEKSRDQDLEKRYLALKQEKNIFTNEPTSSSSSSSTTIPTTDKPNGSIPKPLSMDDFHDEMDDWCCVCNKDATIVCEDCDNDKFCNQCFSYGHQSSMADYEFTKHKAKKYTSPMAK
ncbi:hypothetical protein BJ944DRAFT_262788 [Cunninghamella echinulata]|nr:hypothetical protein BJ944DRAFT_262788 [Cunninghamella echinulata]